MDSPRGRIYMMRAFDEGRATITDAFSEHMFRCLDCRACETACPSGVHFGQMMEDMRAEIVRQRPAHWLARLMLERIFPFPWRFHLVSRLLLFYQRSGLQALARRTGLVGIFGAELAKAEALMPAFSGGPGVALKKTYPAEGERVGTVALFTGCVMNSMLGPVNRATVRLLNAAGYDVVVPGKQVCCGALANHAGLRDAALESARKNIAAFDAPDIQAILINAAGCGSMLKEYGLLLDEGKRFSAKVKDISEFLASSRLKDHLQTPIHKRIGYDDPCHLVHGQRVKSEPRQLLRAIPGIEFVEIDGADQCCGSAGVYNIVQNELSMAILDAKMEKIRNARLDILATGNPGCMFQLRYGAERAGLQLEVVHPVELLERALR
jgi:glycolate oxidase iron-sulfur subunit